ncbi:MAG TPA: OmpA family protein [Puia sp.]|jgi:chemotaxis protein MotB|nr:OmpA family protein [Puia sp.]
MRKLLVGFFIMISFFLISCGPGKELVSTRARVDSLGTVVNQLNGQINQLNGQINQLNGKLADSSAKIVQLKNQNAIAMQEALDCKMAKDAAARRLEELNQAMKANGTSMKEIKRKAADALIQFANAGVDVSYKNGLVYISLQDALLFDAGSAKLGKNGQEALAVVAQVLNDNPNLLIYVVGNTDSVKVTKAKGFLDNWSLSTERANSVVRILRDKYQVSLERVTSAGRGKFNPVADNSTEEGRAANRRTDIILNPDLSRFWDMVDKQP